MKKSTMYQVQYSEAPVRSEDTDWQDVRGALFNTLEEARVNLQYRRETFTSTSYRIVKLIIEVLGD